MTKSLTEYVIEYQEHFKKSKKYYENLSLVLAIEKACNGIKFDDILDSHQYRIKKNTRELSTEKVLIRINDIKKAKTFEDVFCITEKTRISTHGLGDLWSYDTALRIGFHLKINPTKVYVQSGVKKGLKNLLNISRFGKRTFDVNKLPSELQKISPYMIESFLCIMKEELKKVNN